MERKGWIKFHRKLLESAVFGNEKALKIWVWCLLKASHKEHDVLIGRTKLLIRKGQFIMGSERAVDELSLAKATIWYWLNFLEKEGQVRLQKTTKYTVVTLLNWEEYQEDLDTTETPKKRQVGTYKNEENVKNSGVATAPQVEEVLVSEEEETVARPSKKVTPEMQEVFDLFKGNPARFVWKGRVHIREAAKVLHETYGIDELRLRYDVSQSYRNEELCPQIDDPAEFLEKMPKMERFLKTLQA